MYDWFWTNFPELSYSIFRIHNCLYYDRCTIVQVVTDHPWLSATALGLLSAFMLISAVLVITCLLLIFGIVCMLFAAACTAFGNLLGGGLARFMK